MPNEDQPKFNEVGIASLPKSWAVAVQLVGTFGLAVFLGQAKGQTLKAESALKAFI